jgi:hypothetical protein
MMLSNCVSVTSEIANCSRTFSGSKVIPGFLLYDVNVVLTPLQKGDLSTTEITEIAETKDNLIFH